MSEFPVIDGLNSFTLPAFDPRSYQLPFLEAMDSGIKRALLIMHRRAGKDVLCFNFLIKEAFKRVGSYYYFFPTRELGKRVIWAGMNKDGKKFVDYIPAPLIKRKNQQDLCIELINGSVIYILGTDKSVNVGTNPIGAIFSEFALQNPQAWQYISPIFRENGGWAVFNSTPRGANHCYELYRNNLDNEKWFVQKLTVEDTGVLSKDDIEEERRQGMSEELIQQEFYCSFQRGVEGAYYARLINQMELDGRICEVPYDTYAKVNTYWDLGVGDSTAIIWAQLIGNQVHIINYYENSGEGLAHYAKVVDDMAKQQGYIYGDHFAPHDIQVREFGSGARTRLEMARELGLKFQIVPNIPLDEGIENVRSMLPRVWIDNKLIKLREHLENYHKKWDERNGVYAERPVHDRSSHCADAARYMAVSYNIRVGRNTMNESDANDYERRYKR